MYWGKGTKIPPRYALGKGGGEALKTLRNTEQM